MKKKKLWGARVTSNRCETEIRWPPGLFHGKVTGEAPILYCLVFVVVHFISAPGTHDPGAYNSTVFV